MCYLLTVSIPQSLSFTLLIIGVHADVILWSCVKLFSSEQDACALILELKQLVTQTADLHEEACILYIYISVSVVYRGQLETRKLGKVHGQKQDTTACRTKISRDDLGAHGNLVH